ncbi:MAG: hypothetical protein ACK40O_13055 [Allosphingosinicella sp.]
MRDLLSKVMTSSMVAGAALLVAACGGGEDAEANNTVNYSTDDALMGGNDVTSVDAMNGTDANLGAGMDSNVTIDANTVTVDTNTVTPTDANTTGM